MRVAMLTYSTRPRGGVVHALKLSERLVALGVGVTVYSLARSDDPSGRSGFYRSVDVPFEIFSYDHSSDVMERLERMIEAYVSNLPRDPDVYHAQDCVGCTALARMKSRGEISSPVFRTIHHVDDFAEPRLYEFEKRAVASADYRFVVSQYWKRVLKDQFGYESVVTYNGLDMDDFSHLPERTSDVPTVLFVGGLEPRKGLEYLMMAMEFVADEIPRARLVAVGRPGFRGTEQWRWFETLADRLGIRPNLEAYEGVTQEKLLQLYADCDLLALPSKTEGWGLALMEAMACGKPVVASRVGGIPELVNDGLEGVLVDPGDVRGLAEAIVRILRDPALRAEMGSKGRERVKAFSWDDTARTVMREYSRALGHDRANSFMK
ncbi:MAG: MSMEG_0565 family glycosyltransferase [Thermoplasmata archaeon]